MQFTWASHFSYLMALVNFMHVRRNWFNVVIKCTGDKELYMTDYRNRAAGAYGAIWIQH